MNKKCITIVVSLITLFSCNNASETTTSSKSLTLHEAYQKDTCINIPCFEEFIQVTSIGNVDIEYKQGEYSIVAVGNPEVISLLDASFDSGILTVGMKNETRVELSTIKNKQNIKLLVSSPELKYMSICGNGNFHSKGTLKTKLFHTGNLGSGKIVIDTLICDILKIENSNIGEAHFNYADCSSAFISAFGTTETMLHLNAKEEISIYTGENCHMEINAKSPHIEIYTNNNTKGEFDIECEKLNVISKDNSSIILKSVAKEKSIQKDYGCKVTEL
jgi:hypothetical protein